jgi:5-hydroxyisourate hydrolase
MRSPITTHILDTTLGKPAPGVPTTLAYMEPSGWADLASGKTDDDGRIATLLSPEYKLAPGSYRMTFDTKAYFDSLGTKGFYPKVEIHFDLDSPGQHYHIPLLLSPFGYSTYRGS